MQARPDSFLGRLAIAAQRRPALVHLVVPRDLARFLIAAGAQPAPTEAVAVDTQPGETVSRSAEAIRPSPEAVQVPP
jgi:thiamine pyrophosphate-dependent acetolactate synthase large subunit-like protein